MKLDRRYVDKPWGRTELPAVVDAPAGRKIGEVWFTGNADLPLLAKYIFTSERLSIQVHPDEEQARTRGLAHGKSECWYIMDAEPGATVALGIRHELSADELRCSALDGSLEHLVDWHEVKRADFFYVPAGTIHAIGGGVALLEFQQNVDVTYRLYDYGRPRALHLDDAVAVARRTHYPKELARHVRPDEERVLASGPPFAFVQARTDRFRDRRRWVIPLDGEVRSGDVAAKAGECLLLEPGEIMIADNARMLIGAMA